MSIAVFNAAGEAVTALFDGVRNAGFYSVRWDAAALPSGVYYCRMTAGTFRAVRKMVLCK